MTAAPTIPGRASRRGRPRPARRGLRLSRNFGQHRAITAGLEQCRGEWVVVMDCDLQDRPEEIPRFCPGPERVRPGVGPPHRAAGSWAEARRLQLVLPGALLPHRHRAGPCHCQFRHLPPQGDGGSAGHAREMPLLPDHGALGGVSPCARGRERTPSRAAGTSSYNFSRCSIWRSTSCWRIPTSPCG